MLDEKVSDINSNGKGQLTLQYNLPKMLEDFNKTHKEINRVQGRIGIYLSTDKEFTQIAQRCDTRFMENPHDHFNFVVWYTNHFSFRSSQDGNFNWNSKFKDPITVNVDYKPILSEENQKSEIVYVQLILQLYFYQINTETLKIDLSDYSIRLPYNLVEIPTKDLLKQKEDVKPSEAASDPSKTPNQKIQENKPDVVITPTEPESNPKKERETFIEQYLVYIIVLMMFLGIVAYLAVKNCVNLGPSSQQNHPNAVTAQQTSSGPNKGGYEMTSTQSMDSRGKDVSSEELPA